jgi:hypothetical protein
VLGLFARKAAFLRTPKTSGQTLWWEALRANWAESTLAVFGFIGIGAALTKAKPVQRAAASRPAAFPHPRHGCGARQQLGRAPGRAARLAA